jgi:hypothetical protein
MAEPRLFNPESKFKAMRPFTMGGRQYGHDESVDVRGIETRRLRQMFDMRLIDTDKGDAPPPPRKAAVEPPVKQEVAPVASDAKASLRHKGFGKYEIVDAQGNTIAGPFQREQADAELLKYL